MRGTERRCDVLESSEQGVLRLDLSKGQIIMDHYNEFIFYSKCYLELCVG